MSAASLKRKATELASAAKKSKADKSITSFFSAPSTSASKRSLSDSDALIALAEGDSAVAAVPKSQAPPLETATSAALPKFDKEKWVAKLTPEQKELLSLEIETLHESWLAQLKDEVVTKEFLDLKRFLKTEKEAGQKTSPSPSPSPSHRSQHTPLNTVKVVILGQDPYHNDRQAHGLCFSVRPPTPAPQSLANIYKALANDYPTFKPPPKRGGLLTPWADRGVLLLNTCLTVRAHLANSHSKKGWEKFTQKVIDVVNKKRTRGVVFLAWGSPAQGRMKGVNKERHCVLNSVHPSPLSAHKGFFDCGHFKKANEWLKQRYGPGGEIDWDLNAAQKETGWDHQVVATPKAPPPTPADDDVV
ncbi:uracil DNA glycosylase, partial [Peltigera leucophlebia]|nr:uracil DNA glycosylase [Peltigera leucophlebia]